MPYFLAMEASILALFDLVKDEVRARQRVWIVVLLKMREPIIRDINGVLLA